MGVWFSVVAGVRAQQLAFPGAEGFGAFASGGRSGTVYHVTNLNNSGSGSFRDAVIGSNRTIVFDVSGTINLSSAALIRSNNLTIAGQTAPGDGITFMGNLVSVQSPARNVIVRYLRFRPGDINCPLFQEDSFHIDSCRTVIVDHVSASWSEDEVLSVTHSTNVTVQWSMISEALSFSCRNEGGGVEVHGYGSLLRYGSGGLSFHHNLYAHDYSRNPRLGDSIHLDWVNNVLYNWQDQAGYNADDAADNPGGYTHFLNYVGNYLIGGTNTAFGTKIGRAFQSNVPNPAFCQIYQSSNLMDTNRNGVLDSGDRGWAGFQGTYTTNTSRFTFPQVSTDTATTAYVRVLSLAGASALRDAVDTRIVSNVVTQTGSVINSQNQVGGWPTLTSLPTPTDTDQDGMPDYWEVAFGLDPNNAADRNNPTADGYTRLEEYLNWLAGPHARAQTNSVAYVDLRQYTAGLQNPTYTVSSGSNGVVTLLGDGHNAQFTPTPGFSGLGSFIFTAIDSLSSLTGTVVVVATPLSVAGNLVWRGDGTNNWDTVTTADWLNGATTVKFYAGDIVTFNDAGSNSPPINLVGTLLPLSVTVTGSQNYTFGGSGSLGGLMSLVKAGSGQLTLMTSNTFSGGTTVSNGTLLVNGSLGAGAVSVVTGAMLGGTGIIGGPVMVDGALSPGNSAGTLTINNDLVVNNTAALQFDLGTGSDLVAVSGNLTLGGTLNITDAGGFTNTTYTLFTYGGTLTYTPLTIGTAPAGYNYGINTNALGQVQLVVTLNLSAFEQWQIQYFGCTNCPQAASTADPDGDGQSNDAEFQSGSNPTNSASALRILSVGLQGNDVAITWLTAGGHTNAVQATSGNYTTNFTDISGLIVVSGSGEATTNYVDVGGATNNPALYYRVRLVP